MKHIEMAATARLILAEDTFTVFQKAQREARKVWANIPPRVMRASIDTDDGPLYFELNIKPFFNKIFTAYNHDVAWAAIDSAAEAMGHDEFASLPDGKYWMSRLRELGIDATLFLP